MKYKVRYQDLVAEDLRQIRKYLERFVDGVGAKPDTPPGRFRLNVVRSFRRRAATG